MRVRIPSHARLRRLMDKPKGYELLIAGSNPAGGTLLVLISRKSIRMNLVERIESWYAGVSYPPEGYEVDSELVESKDIDKLRWGTKFRNVYFDGKDYVAVEDVSPATEEQDWGDYGEPIIYRVSPIGKTIVVTEWEKIV